MFVRVWQSSNSLEEVASRLEMPKPIVLARKSNYTKLGVRLKKMPRKSSHRGLDVAALNALIDKLESSRTNASPAGSAGSETAPGDAEKKTPVPAKSDDG